ncbi:MAG: hypothetical protein JXB43_05605 [Dehalococcoidia bacterium]|nr:hypothetical protein [Dehalococcoidia bacterium]
MKFRENKTYHWKPLVAGIITAFAFIAIIFALPLKVISTETIETYYVTEMQQEAYSVSEPYITEEVYEKTEAFADGFYKVVPGGIVIPFNIDRPDAKLVGNFENPFPGSFVIFNAANHIIWESLGNRGSIDLQLPQGRYRARFQESVMWGQDCYIYLAIQWTETQQVTKYKEITEYREVPVQVEKQRMIIEQHRISLWAQIFK